MHTLRSLLASVCTALLMLGALIFTPVRSAHAFSAGITRLDGDRVAVHVATCGDVSKPRGLPPGKVVLRRHATVHAMPLRDD